jgi:hypothetical protein
MSKLFCLVILSCLAFSCVAEEQTWEEENPTCVNICSFAELCGYTSARDTWFCDENQCTDDILAGTPLTDDKMILAWCSDGYTDAVKNQETCRYIDTCLVDLLAQ